MVWHDSSELLCLSNEASCPQQYARVLCYTCVYRLSACTRQRFCASQSVGALGCLVLSIPHSPLSLAGFMMTRDVTEQIELGSQAVGKTYQFDATHDPTRLAEMWLQESEEGEIRQSSSNWSTFIDPACKFRTLPLKGCELPKTCDPACR